MHVLQEVVTVTWNVIAPMKIWAAMVSERLCSKLILAGSMPLVFGEMLSNGPPPTVQAT